MKAGIVLCMLCMIALVACRGHAGDAETPGARLAAQAAPPAALPGLPGTLQGAERTGPAQAGRIDANALGFADAQADQKARARVAANQLALTRFPHQLSEPKLYPHITARDAKLGKCTSDGLCQLTVVYVNPDPEHTEVEVELPVKVVDGNVTFIDEQGGS
jgi:hypothetical protein